MARSGQQKPLGERIRQMRRRHFGPRGKAEFAARLGVSAEQYERFERGLIPPGDLLVRMCEVTGEDLQWLLTGVAARGTLVISGARDRHQRLLAEVARLLECSPESAGPLEAFTQLLIEGTAARATEISRPPLPEPQELIPILDDSELPDALSPARTPRRPAARLKRFAAQAMLLDCRRALLVEPDARRTGPDHAAQAEFVRLRDPGGTEREFVRSAAVGRVLRGLFGVRVADDALHPLVGRGDVAVLSAEVGPRIGAPAACRVRGERGLRWRIWLGESADGVALGRLSDGAQETVARPQLAWSLELLYAVRAAA